MYGTSIRVGLASIFVLAGTAAISHAAEFDFKDPKGVNAISFALDSQVEPILGVASGIGGTVAFDPAEPKKTTGKLVVAAKSLHCENQGMKETLYKADWLDVEQFPDITFAFKEIKGAKPLGNDTFELDVVGDFTCRGVTKPISTVVKASYLKGKLGERVRGKEGDLLVLRAQFSIARKDFGIKPDMDGTVVAEKIEIRASIVGANPKK